MVARVVVGGCLPVDLSDCSGVFFVECFGVASFADLVAPLMNFHVLLVSDDCGE